MNNAQSDLKMSRKISVLIINDHPSTRIGVETIVGTNDCCYVFPIHSTVRDAVESITVTSPDLILFDPQLGELDLDGWELASLLREKVPHSRLLIYSGSMIEPHKRSAEKLGISGYISKAISPEGLIAAIQSVADGQLVYSPESSNSSTIRGNEWSDDELALLELVSYGLSNNEIAIKNSV